jgi:hypothetical protein
MKNGTIDRTTMARLQQVIARVKEISERDHNRPQPGGGPSWAFDFGALEHTAKEMGDIAQQFADGSSR